MTTITRTGTKGAEQKRQWEIRNVKAMFYHHRSTTSRGTLAHPFIHPMGIDFGIHCHCAWLPSMHCGLFGQQAIRKRKTKQRKNCQIDRQTTWKFDRKPCKHYQKANANANATQDLRPGKNRGAKWRTCSWYFLDHPNCLAITTQ